MARGACCCLLLLVLVATVSFSSATVGPTFDVPDPIEARQHVIARTVARRGEVVPLANGTTVGGSVGDGRSFLFHSNVGCDWLLSLHLFSVDNTSKIQLHVRSEEGYLGTVSVPSKVPLQGVGSSSQRLFCHACDTGDTVYTLDVLGEPNAPYNITATLEKHALEEGETELDAVRTQDGLHFWYFDVDDADDAPLEVHVKDVSDGEAPLAVFAAAFSSCPVLGGNVSFVFGAPPGYTFLTFEEQATMSISKRGPKLREGRWYFVVISEHAKNFTIKASYGMEYNQYYYIDIGSAAVFALICAIILGSTFMWLRACQVPEEDVATYEEESTRLKISDNEDDDPLDGEDPDTEEPMAELNLTRMERNCLQYIWQYKEHIQLTCLLGAYFGIPAIQTIVAISQEEVSGDRNICYFNERCMRPDTFLNGADEFQLMAWNNIFSNSGYIIAGMSLCLYLMAIQIWRRGRARTHLVPREFSFIWALALGLVGEGFFSAMYHICPTRVVFQVDTVFMFVIGGLFFLELFRKRFGWVWSSWRSGAFAAFLFLLNFLGTSADSAHSDFYKYTLESLVVTAIALGFIATVAWIGFRLYNREAHRSEYTGFFVLVAVSLGVSLLLSILWIAGLSSSQYLLFCVVGSLVIIPFTVHLGFKIWSYFSGGQRHSAYIAYMGQGALLGVGFICFTISIFFFLGLAGVPTTTDKELSPADSRDLNSDCVLLDYYDAHDVWHYLSALGLLLVVLFLFHGDYREVPHKNHDRSYRSAKIYEYTTYKPIH